jgi:hypothetical protein
VRALAEKFVFWKEMRALMAALKPPGDLGVPGRRLFRQVTRELSEADWELDSREQFWLYSASKLADRLAILETEMADQPLIVRGSMGQPVVNSLMSEIRAHYDSLRSCSPD